MAAGGAVYLVATAPLVPKSSLRWTLPIFSVQPVIFWLWARATFDDEFILKRWHGALCLAIVGIGLSVSLAWTRWPALVRSGANTLSVVALVLALSAAGQTVKTWTIRPAGAVFYALAIWTATFAGIGLALRFMSGFSPMRRYLASYWLYLIHMPIVMALQVAVSPSTGRGRSSLRPFSWSRSP
jgi:hypothetical protein